MKEKTAWFIASGFLFGYLFAWGAIALDRHVILESQKELRKEIRIAEKQNKQLRDELRLKEIIDEASSQMEEAVDWNKKAREYPEMPLQMIPMGAGK